MAGSQHLPSHPRNSARFRLTALLTHFTRRSRNRDALDNLVEILRAGVIRGSARLIADKTPAVCMFDAPITELGRLIVRANRDRYQPFGVAVDRRYAFSMGARPVIYMPISEARRMLPRQELWRVVTIDLRRTPPLDWTFEREWRIAGEFRLPPGSAVALVESWRDVEEVYDRFDGAPPCAGVIPLEHLFGSADE
jgi:hypothetical protein